MPLQHSFELPVEKPFDWQHLLAFLRLRATPGVEVVTDSEYTRTIGIDGEPQTLTVSCDPNRATLHVAHSGKVGAQTRIMENVRQIFKPDVNTAPVEAFLARDSWLGRYVSQQPGLRVPGGWSGFEIALRAILGQQVSVPAATTLMGRLVRAAGTRLGETEWLFPTPEQILNSPLSELGVPGSRRETVKTLAGFFAANGDECLALEDVKDRLLALKGIGRWTAGYILMRTGLNHDHWPEGDLVLRKALSPPGAMIAPSALEQAFSRWSPYRSYATIHVWKGFMPPPKTMAKTKP